MTLTTITSKEDIESFVNQLVKEGVNFHPDDYGFEEYVSYKTGERTYSDAEAELRNKLLSSSFTFCENNGFDIYELCFDAFTKATGFNKFFNNNSTN